MSVSSRKDSDTIMLFPCSLEYENDACDIFELQVWNNAL